MKTPVAISAIVLAILATVVTEEIRISQLRDELISLREIPEPSDSSLSLETPDSAESTLDDLQEEPEPTPEPPAAVPPTADPSAPPSLRKVPDEFPEPDEDQTKSLSLSPYADLHYDLGLTNRERTYLDGLLAKRRASKQELAMKWAQASSKNRSTVEDEAEEVLKASDERIQEFLRHEPDFKAFLAFEAMQAERELVAEMRPLMDHRGAPLDKDEEYELARLLYQVRQTTNSIDWNSPAALTAIAEGGAPQRFEREWKTQTTAIALQLPRFLDEKKSAAVLESREELKAGILSNISSLSEALAPASTTQGAQDRESD